MNFLQAGAGNGTATQSSLKNLEKIKFNENDEKEFYL